MADSPIALVVGLGNPGSGHAEDRHNVGFWFLDALADKLGVTLNDETRYQGQFGRAANGLRLLKPTTFMNLSGESVAACANYFRIPPEQILIVHDELDLAPGDLRLKRGGGHGGHNGLRSIHSHLSADAYKRARIGIGHPGHARDVSPYVLGKPKPEEREVILNAIASLLDQFDLLVSGDFSRAMNTLNQRAKPTKGED